MEKLRQLIAVVVCVGLASTGVVSTSFADHDRDSKGYKQQQKSDYDKKRQQEDGAALYRQYCAGCHGSGMRGESVSATSSAISSNVGGMGSFRSLTPAQLTAISQY